MTIRTKVGDLIFLNSKSPLPYKVVGKKPGTVQVENITNGFKMFVTPSRMISIRQTKQRKIEIESILERNKQSNPRFLDENDIDKFQLELNLINNRLERLKQWSL